VTLSRLFIIKTRLFYAFQLTRPPVHRSCRISDEPIQRSVILIQPLTAILDIGSYTRFNNRRLPAGRAVSKEAADRW
jgi:hypothetical protein